MAATDRDVLPSTIKPSHYVLDLYDLELGGGFAFKGTVKIDLSIASPVKSITINAYELELKTADVAGQKATNISYDKKKQRATCEFEKEINSGPSLLQIEFTGVINHSMSGFYRSLYKPAVPPAKSVPMDEDQHVMFSTQFESSDARRAFPCFDEPNLKASFDVSIEIPEDLTALSNMPEKEVKNSKTGLKTVYFEKTPTMSTYLLAWAVGDFEYVEAFTARKYNGKPLPVRVYTTKGLKEKGQLGLSVCHQVVDYFSETFKIDYPLPKLDLLAVHEFSHGAMENWGLITYRTTAILFDEAKSDAKYKNRVSYVVAHELAHQWFGNLVTMDWWNELWLNEGFATWVGWLAIDHLFPDYQVWSQFVTEAMQMAQNLDSLRASHPIEVPVRDALEVDQIFDVISYMKGSSVIRMLSAHLGVEIFLKGVSEYLKKHAYGNATTKDLWSALSEASGQDVNAFMDPWIRKIGFPVLTIAEEPGQLGVRQSRFLSTGDIKPGEDETVWWVPLGLKTGTQTHKDTANALTKKEETLRDIDESFYKINSNQVGVFRTNYPPSRLIKLGEQRAKLSVEDRIGLIADASALAIAGQGTSASFLALVESFQDETSYHVWSQIASSLANIQSVFATSAVISEGLKSFILKLVGPVTGKVGWEPSSKEGFLEGQLRALLIGVAGGAGHQQTIDEARRRFKTYLEGESQAIPPSLRSATFKTVIGEGGRAEYDSVKREYSQTTSIDGKEICLASLGRVSDPDTIVDFMDFQFSDAVATQDKHTGSVALALNGKARDALWAYIKKHWEKISGVLGGNPVVLDRYVKSTLSKFASHEIERDIAAFFKDRNTDGFDRGLVQVSDSIRANAAYKERDEGLLLEWLKAHGYVN